MRVGLSGITDTSGGELESVHCPAEVIIPINATKRKLEAEGQHFFFGAAVYD